MIFYKTNSDGITRTFTEAEEAPEGFTEISREAYDAWIAANPAPVVVPSLPVPQSITRRQLFRQLAALGYSKAQLSAAVTGAMPEGLARELILIDIDEASSFERSNPDLAAMAGIVGLDTPEKIDAFFIAAGSIV